MPIFYFAKPAIIKSDAPTIRRGDKATDRNAPRAETSFRQDWVAFLGLPPGDVSLVDADLSTVSSLADRLIRVDAPGVSYIVHNELESGKDTAGVPLRLFRYNASAVYKTGLSVASTVLATGRVESELREARRLGEASPLTAARLEPIDSLEILEDLLDRVFEVETWDDLLAGMPTIRR